jgi:hypothetical protein
VCVTGMEARHPGIVERLRRRTGEDCSGYSLIDEHAEQPLNPGSEAAASTVQLVPQSLAQSVAPPHEMLTLRSSRYSGPDELSHLGKIVTSPLEGRTPAGS